MSLQIQKVDLPAIKTFTLLGNTADVTVEMVRTTSDIGRRSIRLCLKDRETITGAKFQTDSLPSTVNFIRTLWESCKRNTNYTLRNMSVIGRETAYEFPTLCRHKETIEELRKTLADPELLEAYMTATQHITHQNQIAIFTEPKNQIIPHSHNSPAYLN